MNYTKYLTTKRFKFMAAFFCLVGLVPTNIANRVVLQPNFCVQCHMMKPEYYTWQNSTHAGVGCVSCHIAPGPKNVFEGYKAGIQTFVKLAQDTYVTPINMLKPTDDKACEQCHDVEDLDRSKNGSIIIPHGKHKVMNVRCFKCHRGIAHGKIADRQASLEGSYAKWNDDMGDFVMKDKQYTKPDMEMCFRCHTIRSAPLECKACHTKSVKPASHKDVNFKTISHGKLASEDLKSCDSCHKYTSTEQTAGVEEDKASLAYLKQEKEKRNNDALVLYSRTNTYCRKCHSKRPASHQGDFINGHAGPAQKDKERCTICHENQLQIKSNMTELTGEQPVTRVSCANCHPSIHSESVQWKLDYHPVPLPAKPRLNNSCYKCHIQQQCGKCHGTFK